MRCFIGVPINDNELKTNIMAFQKLLGKVHIRMVNPENLHITLKFLGEISEKNAAELIKDMKNIRFVPFTCKFRGIGVFPSLKYIKVIYITMFCKEIYELHSAICDKLPLASLQKDRPFKAHLTVGRVKRLNIREREKLLEYVNKYRDRFFGEQLIDRLSLVKSVLTPKGPVYTCLYTKIQKGALDE